MSQSAIVEQTVQKAAESASPLVGSLENAERVAQSIGSALQNSDAVQEGAKAGDAALGAAFGANYSFAWANYFEALAILFGILALLWFGLWLLKKRLPNFKKSQVPSLQLESRLAIDSKRWLVVVNFMGKRLLLGVAEQNISLLASYDDEKEDDTDFFAKASKEAEAWPQENTRAERQQDDFATLLRGNSERPKA